MSSAPHVEFRNEDAIVRALKARQGRATLGDLVADTGLPQDALEQQVQRLMGVYRSHLEVDEGGELLYRFEPSMVRRDADQTGALKRAVYDLAVGAYRIFKFVFKIAIAATLVVYFVVFVVLVILAILASLNNRSSSRNRSPLSGIAWVWSSSRRQSMQGGAMSIEAMRGEQVNELPFHQSVFAFVFGPEANEDDTSDRAREEERQLLRFIRDRKGVVTAAELTTQTGWSLDEAEERVAELLVRYQGDPRVSEEGVIVYVFERLVVSAAEGAKRAEPADARYEPKRKLTGNSSKRDGMIGFFNAFVGVGGMIAPFMLLPRLGISVNALTVGALSTVPLVFSIVFFAVPAIRWLLLKRENAARAERNLARFVQRELVRRARLGGPVRPHEVAQAVMDDVPKDAAWEYTEHQVTAAVETQAKLQEAERVSTPQGTAYRFERLGEELEVAERYRALIEPEQLKLGKIVFSTAESEDAMQRDDLDRFEREITGAPDPSAAHVPLSERQLAQAAPGLDGFDRALAGPTHHAPGADDAEALDAFDARLSEAEAAAEVSAPGVEVSSKQTR